MADLPMIANKVIKLDVNNLAEMQRELNDYADDGFKVVAAFYDGARSIFVFLTRG